MGVPAGVVQRIVGINWLLLLQSGASSLGTEGIEHKGILHSRKGLSRSFCRRQCSTTTGLASAFSIDGDGKPKAVLSCGCILRIFPLPSQYLCNRFTSCEASSSGPPPPGEGTITAFVVSSHGLRSNSVRATLLTVYRSRCRQAETWSLTMTLFPSVARSTSTFTSFEEDIVCCIAQQVRPYWGFFSNSTCFLFTRVHLEHSWKSHLRQAKLHSSLRSIFSICSRLSFNLYPSVNHIKGGQEKVFSKNGRFDSRGEFWHATALYPWDLTFCRVGIYTIVNRFICLSGLYFNAVHIWAGTAFADC